MELLQYWKIIRKSWMWIAGIVVAGLILAGIYTSTQPTQYRSAVTLLLNPMISTQLAPYVNQSLVASSLASSYSARIVTRSFAQSVATQFFTDTNTTLGVGEYILSINTQLIPNTLFYQISARASSPERSQQIVAATVKVFMGPEGVYQNNPTSSDSGTQAQIQSSIDAANRQIDANNARLDDLLKETPVNQAEITSVRNTLATLTASKTTLLQLLQQANGSQASQDPATIVDAPLPGLRVDNGLLRNMALAFAVFLLLGIGVAFLRDYLDYTISSPEALEDLLGAPALAAISEVSAAEKQKGRRGSGKSGSSSSSSSNKKVDTALPSSSKSLLVLEKPNSTEAENLRVLRTNIMFAGTDSPIKSLVVTSTGPGEGKSFTAANLAVVMAQAGQRVIVVDADLRRPTLHGLFKLPNSMGFTNLLIAGDTLTMADVAQHLPGVPNLAVITSGPLPPNPSELLNSRRGLETMKYLSEQADMVIYDSPPAGAVTDPLIIGARVDAVLMVISAVLARKDVVLRIIKSMKAVGIENILPMLNRVKIKEMHGYYYYRYYGHYRTDDQADAAAKAVVVHSNGTGEGVDDKKVVVPVASGRKSGSDE